ncbi:MAG TPA: PAS domain S-box protein, partial [Stellaceae bacterium]|nr:PAS domain S-box protein [Stellaceae bacterium]
MPHFGHFVPLLTRYTREESSKSRGIGGCHTQAIRSAALYGPSFRRPFDCLCDSIAMRVRCPKAGMMADNKESWPEEKARLEARIAELSEVEARLHEFNETLEERAEGRARQLAAHDTRLEAAEQHLALIIDAVVDYAIFMLDPAGNVVSWNPGAQRIKGYQREEIVGQHFSRFYTPNDRAQGVP